MGKNGLKQRRSNKSALSIEQSQPKGLKSAKEEMNRFSNNPTTTRFSTPKRLLALVAIATIFLTGIIFAFLLDKLEIEKTKKEDPATDASSSANQNASVAAEWRSYQVLEVFPHDTGAFTQGLTFNNGKLYEGTGNYGQSELRHVDPQTGRVIQSQALDDEFFGEGISFFTSIEGTQQVIQLTWREQKGFIYDADTFHLVKEFDFTTNTNQGWGITFCDTRKEFIVSDGSEWLYFWDRDTLMEKRRMKVMFVRPLPTNQRDDKTETSEQPVQHLNELEFEAGSILANLWYQDVIVRIDPETGYVKQAYDFRTLYPRIDRIPEADCFNGISITDREGELYVTGKQWPSLFRVKLL